MLHLVLHPDKPARWFKLAILFTSFIARTRRRRVSYLLQKFGMEFRKSSNRFSARKRPKSGSIASGRRLTSRSTSPKISPAKPLLRSLEISRALWLVRFPGWLMSILYSKPDEKIPENIRYRTAKHLCLPLEFLYSSDLWALPFDWNNLYLGRHFRGQRRRDQQLRLRFGGFLFSA